MRFDGAWLLPGTVLNSDGENMPLRIDPAQVLGVVPVPDPMPRGLVTVGGGGSHEDMLPPYEGMACGALLEVVMTAESGLRPSPGTVDGGVRRFPTLVCAVGVGCMLVTGTGLEIWLPKGGMGNSIILGRLFAAGRRAVRLDDWGGGTDS